MYNSCITELLNWKHPFHGDVDFCKQFMLNWNENRLSLLLLTMASFMGMLNRIVGNTKQQQQPVYNDEITKKPVYKNQPTDITDTKLVLQIVDLEHDIKIIQNKYRNCTGDPIRQKLLWRMFLEKSNSLILLKNQNDYDNSKLLKVMYKNVTNPNNIKSSKKIYKRLEKYNSEYTDRNGEDLLMYDDEILKSEFMSSTIENLGLSEFVEDDSTLITEEVEEEVEEEFTDQLPLLPTTQILIPSMKSSTSTTVNKSVSFGDNVQI